MQNDKELLARSANNIAVWFDPINSRAAAHFLEAPQLRDITKGLITQAELHGSFVGFHKDMERFIGDEICVATDSSDEIIYAKCKNRQFYTRFTKSRQAQPTPMASIALSQQADGSYELISAWIGPADSPPSPGDKNETPNSKDYWENHAVVWGTQDIQIGTETTQRPW